MARRHDPDPTALHRVLPDSLVAPFLPTDLAELEMLQRCCWVQEAILNNTLEVPALHESADEVEAWATTWTTLIVRRRGRLVAAVRGRQEGTDWQVGRLMVVPDLVGRGIGSALLGLIEEAAPQETERFVLFTGGKSTRNVSLYQRAGYRLAPAPDVSGHIAGAVYMIKNARPRT